MSKTKEEWLLKGKQIEAAHRKADRKLKQKELELETLTLQQAVQERQASEKQERLDCFAAEEKKRAVNLAFQERRRFDRIAK